MIGAFTESFEKANLDGIRTLEELKEIYEKKKEVDVTGVEERLDKIIENSGVGEGTDLTAVEGSLSGISGELNEIKEGINSISTDVVENSLGSIGGVLGEIKDGLSGTNTGVEGYLSGISEKLDKLMEKVSGGLGGDDDDDGGDGGGDGDLGNHSWSSPDLPEDAKIALDVGEAGERIKQGIADLGLGLEGLTSFVPRDFFTLFVLLRVARCRMFGMRRLILV
ncbi:MAG: hypothetical protein LIQ31_01780 [Planctomycetes bacterium]|nr:hypothetical protein [Planctomycetota bacterium]